mmetsp:Transcript_7130/g.14035  ORF Transcript_7130/g.14035 Transcript_7130/m.14035 type:complete len:99 (-) Transcript_7130:22-318(-)
MAIDHNRWTGEVPGARDYCDNNNLVGPVVQDGTHPQREFLHDPGPAQLLPERNAKQVLVLVTVLVSDASNLMMFFHVGFGVRVAFSVGVRDGFSVDMC